ncbi:DegQ family serine endoprotease [candidate division KSB1 bacterium]|nr:DegQ family serine endoprotease [candidate division KSB1 bacterium]NIR71490.1 DegQ family serine endoprotease [candidate division KSB1 bacterium]NIS23411.1 DegQ family serine endoprotease [candidate division KSB1 bacterium]NIT70302.1 DegQ family serine endoprotease [candidate division KSB1 bacterium]NIU24025.1 DegQ family serine endoprotease [candidate division KSB1 bacterium]
MNKKSKKTLLAAVSITIGIVVGLVIASNLSLTQNGIAENRTPYIKTSEGNPSVTSSSDLESTSRGFVEIAKKVSPTVVAITSEKVVKVRDPFAEFFNDDFFRRFFRDPGGREREYRQRGLGSGVIVSPDGYIITNYHVIKDADEINVLRDGDEFDAEIIGTDPASDIAVIKIDENSLPAVTLGDSDKLEVGEWVLAIGSPFDLRLQHTVTSGIISAKGRALNLSNELTYEDFIQTDAAINPGNSGGALVNIKGELIGINTAIYAGKTGGNVGIGFAIPINLAKRVMDDLIEHGKVYRGYLGVYITTPDEELSEALNLKDNKGAVVNEVVRGTPADKAGLKKYDVIIEVDNTEVADSQMLTNLIATYQPGDKIDLTIIRDGKSKALTVKLEERPSSSRQERPAFSQESDMLGGLGLELSTLSDEMAERYGYEDDRGVLVTNVLRGSVAEEKGVRVGDLVKEVNRQKVSSVTDVERIIDNLDQGDIVLFQIRRDSRNFFVAMRVPKS